MTVDGATIPVTLGFVPSSVAVPDVDRPWAPPCRSARVGALCPRERRAARRPGDRHLPRRRRAARPARARLRHGGPLPPRRPPAGVRSGARRRRRLRRGRRHDPLVPAGRHPPLRRRPHHHGAPPGRRGLHHAQGRPQRDGGRGTPVARDERPRRRHLRPCRPGRVRHAAHPADGRAGPVAAPPRLTRRGQPRRRAHARQPVDPAPADHPAAGARRRAQHRSPPPPAPLRARHRDVPRPRGRHGGQRHLDVPPPPGPALVPPIRHGPPPCLRVRHLEHGARRVHAAGRGRRGAAATARWRTPSRRSPLATSPRSSRRSRRFGTQGPRSRHRRRSATPSTPWRPWPTRHTPTPPARAAKGRRRG